MALVILALIVLMAGGLRFRAAGVRVFITSPYRVLLWAVLVAVIRHVFAREAPIYRDLPARIAAAWRTAAVRTSVTAAIGTRVPILLVGYLAIFMVGFRAAPPFRVDANEFLNLQARADTGWYLGIAIEGYRYSPESDGAQQNIVFFPALPMLMRATGRLFGGSLVAFMAGGTAAVLLAFVGGLVYVFRLARELLDSEEAARHAVWFLATFPFAVFFSALYTESLFLLAAAGAFFHFRRHEFVRAGALGLVAGLTRPNGCFLSVPLGIMAISPWLPRPLARGSFANEKDAAPTKSAPFLSRALTAAAMPGIGVLAYSAYIWRLTGDPFAWAAAHLAWGRAYQGLGAVVSEHFAYLSHLGVYEYTARLPYDVLNVLGALFVLIAAVPVAARLGVVYSVFILINLLPPLAAGGTMSIGRFSTVLFPAFMWFGSAVPERHRTAWLAAFMALQAMNAVLFYTWRPLI